MRGGDFTTSTRAVQPADLDALIRPGVRIPRSAYAKMAGRPIGEIIILPARPAPPPLVAVIEAEPEPEAAADFTLPCSMPRRVRDVVAALAHAHGYTFDQMIQTGRSKAAVSKVRQEAYWVVRQMGFSLKQIATFFCRDDHTSILSGLRQHEARKAKNMSALDGRAA